MIYTVHQPHYLPYPGYLAKVDAADMFVFLEHVQYVRREWQNRNRVKGADGTQWLTVPVKGDYKARISEMTVDDSLSWKRKHIDTLRRFYARAPFLQELDGFADVIETDFDSLAELTMATTKFFLNRFKIETPIRTQGSFESLFEDPNRRIIDIGKALGAETYLAGSGGRDYMNLEAFAEARIEVLFQEYSAMPYPQFHGDFVPDLGAIDLLLCAGSEGFDSYIRPMHSSVTGDQQ